VSRGGFEALDPCVHCGFCLPACPTYLATGDESDSPRGRILLMRALERGELPADDPAVREHLDACLGCRGCEPVCPAGVGYGRGLEAARERLAAANGLGGTARTALAVFRRESLWRPLLAAARLLRGTGLPRRLAGGGRLGFAMGMVAASARRKDAKTQGREGGKAERRSGGGSHGPAFRPLAPISGPPSAIPPDRPTVAVFRGCVMDALFGHVHDAVRRTLEVNGYRVVEVPGQSCCGALHEHAGDRTSARTLLRANAEAFAGRADLVAVDSAGCGALLKDAAHLDPGAAARELAGKVRDVSELLAAAGPRPGGALELALAYDAPCHLEQAQGVRDAPLTLLGAIPGLRVRRLPGSERCCGSAGIYSLLHPAMSRAVLDAKIRSIAEASPRPGLVATGNPGCVMQIGAGLRAAGLDIGVVHPVEVLDWSYAEAGYYD
jgi:glycolate dehydrogenase iron-sulfur subunit